MITTQADKQQTDKRQGGLGVTVIVCDGKDFA
jgi:hypothetical protein